MSSVPRLAAAVGAIALVAACGGGGNRGTTDGYVSGDGTITTVPVADREAAPVLEGEDLDGRPLSTADFAGKTVVVNVWGPWCPPCRAEADDLEQVAQQYADRDVQLVGVLNRSKNPASAQAFVRRKGITYPSFRDQGGQLELGFVKTLPSVAVPTTWVIDAKGRVAARVLGPVTASTLANLVDDVRESVA